MQRGNSQTMKRSHLSGLGLAIDVHTLNSSDAFVPKNNRDGNQVNASSIKQSLTSTNYGRKNKHGLFIPNFLPSHKRFRAGNVERRKERRIINHIYHDYASDQNNGALDEDPLGLGLGNSEMTGIETHKFKEDFQVTKPQRRGPRGGVATPFPMKLHQLLDQDEHSDIISWQPHGRCFVLHKPQEFLDKVMNLYFRQTKLTSFQRQLNLYGFCRLTSGPDKGGYYHELFLRGKKSLCKRMMRIRIKGTGIKAASSPETEPNFYVMPPIKEDQLPNMTIRPRLLSEVSINDEILPSAPILTTKSGMFSFGGNAMSMPSNSAPIRGPQTYADSSRLPFPAPVTPIGCKMEPNRFPSPLPAFLNLGSSPCNEHNQELPTAVSSSSFSQYHNTQNNIQSHHDDIIMFEGKTFHYLDPLFLIEESGESPEKDSDFFLSSPSKHFSTEKQHSNKIKIINLEGVLSVTGKAPNVKGDNTDGKSFDEFLSSATSVQSLDLPSCGDENSTFEGDDSKYEYIMDDPFDD